RIPASAIDWSAVGPSEAPVYKLTLKSSFFPRSDNAKGNSFGSPNNVKPLIPKVIPSLIQDAASSAETTLSKKASFLMTELKSTPIKNHLIYNICILSIFYQFFSQYSCTLV